MSMKKTKLLRLGFEKKPLSFVSLQVYMHAYTHAGTLACVYAGIHTQIKYTPGEDPGGALGAIAPSSEYIIF